MESKGNTRGENNCEIAFSRVACACAGLHILKKYIRQGLVSVSMLKFLVLGTHERASQNENGAREKTWTIEGVRMTACVRRRVHAGACSHPPGTGGLQYIQPTRQLHAARGPCSRALARRRTRQLLVETQGEDDYRLVHAYGMSKNETCGLRDADEARGRASPAGGRTR